MGLRERKREQTRQRLADAALDLFAERGYDATTIADIAERADVSPRTFFAHHPSKEHVIFCDDDDLVEDLAAQLQARPPGQPTLGALRDWIAGLVDEENPALHGREMLRRQVIARTPVLVAHEQLQRARFEVVIREAVAVDLGDHPDDLRPRLLAAAATAALESARPGEGDGEAHPEQIMAGIDQALAFLQGGLDALRTA